ncbi:MAG: winged helix-turn-helix domain-containing protein [Gammaproteobacteria bacterium]|nr:winged helix-turn-helix domain-containing protein [Gammaproteobacteria bacterium]
MNFLLAPIPEGAVSPTAIALPVPKQVIASRLSSKPETLSRILHELAHAGIVEVNGPLVEIIDIKALTRFAAA